MNRLAVVDLGRRPYGEVLELQRELCRRRVAREAEGDVLLLVEHDPVFTLGRGTRTTSLPVPAAQLGADVHEVERGGDVTYHGPGQLVGYPIIDLTGHRQDLHWYLRELEGTLIDALGELGIAAERRQGLTGVWTAGRKIASIGVHVKQWVTLHGFALNVTTDLAPFERIVPCGIQDVVMTSVARELGNDDPDLMQRTRDLVVEAFGKRFGLDVVWENGAERRNGGTAEGKVVSLAVSNPTPLPPFPLPPFPPSRPRTDIAFPPRPSHPPNMADESRRSAPAKQADERISEILRAAASWAKEAPNALEPAIRAVCIRLAEMVADQRNYLAPLPEPQESERRAVLEIIAERLRSPAVTRGIESHLQALAEMELRSTGSWSLVPGAQNEWIETAIRYLERCGRQLPAGEQPDPYWADDVVAGIIASARALIGIDELQARTEARYSGGVPRPVLPPED